MFGVIIHASVDKRMRKSTQTGILVSSQNIADTPRRYWHLLRSHTVNQELNCFRLNLHDCTWPPWRLYIYIYISVSLPCMIFTVEQNGLSHTHKNNSVCSHPGNLLHHLCIFTVAPRLSLSSVCEAVTVNLTDANEKGLPLKTNNLWDDTCLLQLQSLRILPLMLRSLSRKASLVAFIRQIPSRLDWWTGV